MAGKDDRQHESCNLPLKFVRWSLPLAIMIAAGSIGLSLWQFLFGDSI